MDSELEVIHAEMEATRGSLAEKIGVLETQVRDTVTEAGEAVTATKEGVKDVVSSVTETVTHVKESIQETFNISKHVESHPWAAFGVAIAVGAAGGFALTPSKSAPASAPTPTPPASPSYSSYAAPSEPSTLGLVFSRLQGLALGSLIDVVKDMVDQSAPESWKDGLKGAINDVASHLTSKH